jgi:hypothetical protein
VIVLDGKDYAQRTSITVGSLANNLRFSPDKNLLFVGVGDRDGSIALIDTTRDVVKATFALDAFPKQFELDGQRLYANIPSRHIVQVFDSSTGKSVARWSVCTTGNVPMALDAVAHRLFIGCKGGRYRNLIRAQVGLFKRLLSLPGLMVCGSIPKKVDLCLGRWWFWRC